MSPKNTKKILNFLSKVILIALLIVLLIRCFLIESYTMSSSQMKPSILDGDQVLVDKTAYGIRMPMTLLTVPFTFDTFFGRKSYSTLLQSSYKRLFEKKVALNDVILFNNPIEAEKPLDKRTLIVSRCTALPGDTVTIDEPGIYYHMVVPASGMIIELTENNLNIYRQIILSEQRDRARIEYTNLYINNIKQDKYAFVNDYYWVLSDNSDNKQDSRSLGFIPMQNIIGKVRYIWYSSDNNMRWERFFSTVK